MNKIESTHILFSLSLPLMMLIVVDVVVVVAGTACHTIRQNTVKEHKRTIMRSKIIKSV